MKHQSGAIGGTVVAILVMLVVLGFLGSMLAGVGGVVLWMGLGAVAIIGAAAVALMRRSRPEPRQG
jgi:hypothetical protein